MGICSFRVKPFFLLPMSPGASFLQRAGLTFGRFFTLVAMIVLFVLQTSVWFYAHLMLKHGLRTFGNNAGMHT